MSNRDEVDGAFLLHSIKGFLEQLREKVDG